MWIAYVLLCRDIEIACDERVIVTVVIACVVVCFLTNPKSGSKTYAAVDGYTDCEGMDIRIDSKEQLERFKQEIDEELDIDKAFLDIVGGASYCLGRDTYEGFKERLRKIVKEHEATSQK